MLTLLDHVAFALGIHSLQYPAEFCLFTSSVDNFIDITVCVASNHSADSLNVITTSLPCILPLVVYLTALFSALSSSSCTLPLSLV